MQAVQDNLAVFKGEDYVLEMTSCTIDGEEQMGYTTYGICVKLSDGQAALCHHDISTSREFVEQFITMCIDNHVSVIHIEEVLEDYLD